MEKQTFLSQHLHDANETYLQHLGFTLRVACTLVVIAVVAVLHGLMPFILTHTASGMLCKLMDEMKARKALCESRRMCSAKKDP
jgi:hypothetical protein